MSWNAVTLYVIVVLSFLVSQVLAWIISLLLKAVCAACTKGPSSSMCNLKLRVRPSSQLMEEA
jgi:hypothetical protein